MYAIRSYYDLILQKKQMRVTASGYVRGIILAGILISVITSYSIHYTKLYEATPVQFYTGWDYYVNGLKSLRNKSANMDVLVAMGSSVAYFYSMALLIFPAFGQHVYFETSAVT